MNGEDSEIVLEVQSSRETTGEESSYAADDHVSLKVLTLGSDAKMRKVPVTATIADVVNSVRLEPATDWSDIAILLCRDDHEPRSVSPDQTIIDADAQSGDTIIFAHSIKVGSGWQTVAEFLGASAASGVTGNFAYDLLKSKLRAMAKSWRSRHGNHLTPSGSQDEVLGIARACLCIDMGIEDPQSLAVEYIHLDTISPEGSESWTVSFSFGRCRTAQVGIFIPSDRPDDVEVYMPPSY